MMRSGSALFFASLAALGGLAFTAAAQQPPLQPQQGWSVQQRQDWYEGTQGSRLMPLAWMLALEQAGSSEKFLSDANITRYRYLPYVNRAGVALPIGFAIDGQDDSNLKRTKLRWKPGQRNRERWVGLNCAACHTGRIDFNGRTMLVDGAPGMGDFQSFVDGANAALAATRADQAKWGRFSAAVLGSANSERNRRTLAREFDKLLAYQQLIAASNVTPLRYGYSRVDAFGYIFNKIALFTGAERPGFNPPDAPVSYPFIWGNHRQLRTQWNGAASNDTIKLPGGREVDTGALGRNAGEVVGVFGEIVPRRWPAAYRSSIDFVSLNSLEQVLEKLQPPPWPAHFPAIDKAAAARGRDLFVKMNCHTCHEAAGEPKPMERMSRFKPIVAGEPPADTDIKMACNAYSYAAPSGYLNGAKITRTLPDGTNVKDRIQQRDAIANMAPVLVKRALLGSAMDVARVAAQTATNSVPRPRVVDPSAPESLADPCRDNIHENLAYKARSLEGIWATAPYLHNGSVANLHELLLPPARRMTTFLLGSREFDPKHVGFSQAASPANSFTFDTRMRGNSKLGHDYGAARLDANDGRDRTDLVEYLKTL